MNIITSTVSELGRLGLIADIAGAFLIARAVVVSSNANIFDRSKSRFGYNSAATIEAITAKYESLIGSILLFIGFAGQYFSTLANGNKNRNLKLDLYWAIICFMIVVLTIYCSKYRAEKATNRLINKD
jgi:hypothetical protein